MNKYLVVFLGIYSIFAGSQQVQASSLEKERPRLKFVGVDALKKRMMQRSTSEAELKSRQSVTPVLTSLTPHVGDHDGNRPASTSSFVSYQAESSCRSASAITLSLEDSLSPSQNSATYSSSMNGRDDSTTPFSPVTMLPKVPEHIPSPKPVEQAMKETISLVFHAQSTPTHNQQQWKQQKSQILQTCNNFKSLMSIETKFIDVMIDGSNSAAVPALLLKSRAQKFGDLQGLLKQVAEMSGVQTVAAVQLHKPSGECIPIRTPNFKQYNSQQDAVTLTMQFAPKGSAQNSAWRQLASLFSKPDAQVGALLSEAIDIYEKDQAKCTVTVQN